MAGSKKVDLKLIVGILISLLCIVLAFRKVDLNEMGLAFKKASYWYLLPTVMVVFFSHYLRALRWRYLLDPIRRVDIGSLFSSLIIGYAANTVTPAHLGELLRTYVLSKKRRIPMSQVFATVVVERIILDGFSLLALMLLALLVYPYPFPALVVKSGYILFAGTIGVLIFLIFLKKATSPTMRCVRFLLRPLPDRFSSRVEAVLESALAGLLPLKRWYHYVITGLLSFGIWFCYGLVFSLCLHAFNFVNIYHLNWVTSLTLLVITTIAVAVPSSPGYVGTYHYLCQITLALFSVPEGPALSFATLVHAINFGPVLIVGLFFAHREGMAILKMSENAAGIRKAAHQEVV